MRLSWAFLLLILWLPQARAAQAPAPVPAAMQSFRLPGDGPWDYVTYDPVHARVFIGRYDGVQVVSGKTGKLEMTIGARTGDHGAIVATGAHRVFTSDAQARRLGSYDWQTLAAQQPVPLGGEPDGLAYDPVSHRVLAFLPRTHEIVAVDPRALRVTARADVGGEPEAAAADGHGAMFVSLRDTGEVIRLDTATLRITARWKPGCERPSPLAFDAQARRLFVGCRDSRLLVMDAENGQVVAQAPTGEGTDGLVFDPARQLAIAANGSGTLTLVHLDAPDQVTVQAALATPQGARTLALDAAAGRVFTVTADIASVQPPTKARPYPRLIPKAGTFRLIAVRLPH